MMNTILGKSSPEQPSAKAYYYAWPNRMRVFLGVSTRGLCLWQEPLDCTLALKTGDKGVDLNPSSVPRCAEQDLPTACPWEVVSQITVPRHVALSPARPGGGPLCCVRWLSPPGLRCLLTSWHLFRHLGPSLMPVGPGSEPPVDLRRLLLDLFFWEPVSRKTYQLALIVLDSLPRVLHLGTILLSLPYQTSLDIGLRTPLPSHENRRHCCAGASH